MNLITNHDHRAASHAYKRARFARQRMLDMPWTCEQEASSVAFWRQAAQSWRVMAANQSEWRREVDRLLGCDSECV